MAKQTDPAENLGERKLRGPDKTSRAKSRTLTALEFEALRPALQSLSNERVEAARQAMVDGKKFNDIAAVFGWKSRQSVDRAVSVVWAKYQEIPELVAAYVAQATAGKNSQKSKRPTKKRAIKKPGTLSWSGLNVNVARHNPTNVRESYHAGAWSASAEPSSNDYNRKKTLKKNTQLWNISSCVGFSVVRNSATFRHVCMGGEAEAGGYAIVATEYANLSPKGQQQVAALLKKGYLTRMDVSAIISMISTEKPGGVQVSPAPSFGDPEESTNAWMWRRVVGGKAEYMSKKRLTELVNTQEN